MLAAGAEGKLNMGGGLGASDVAGVVVNGAGVDAFGTFNVGIVVAELPVVEGASKKKVPALFPSLVCAGFSVGVANVIDGAGVVEAGIAAGAGAGVATAFFASAALAASCCAFSLIFAIAVASRSCFSHLE